MASATISSLPETGGRSKGPSYRLGELVQSAGGDPTLYEVIGVGDNGLLHLRGVEWAPGYSAWVAAREVRPATPPLGRRVTGAPRHKPPAWGGS